MGGIGNRGTSDGTHKNVYLFSKETQTKLSKTLQDILKRITNKNQWKNNKKAKKSNHNFLSKTGFRDRLKDEGVGKGEWDSLE